MTALQSERNRIRGGQSNFESARIDKVH